MTFKNWLFILPLLLVVLFLYFIGKVHASTTGTVTATVTVQNISLSVDVSSIAFGAIGTSSTEDTTTAGVNNSVTVTNDGNIPEDINVKAGNSTNWTLSASAGSEAYTMKSCVTNCDSAPTWASVGIDPSYTRLASSVASSSANTRNLDLQVGTPTVTTQTGQQSITVTVQAAAVP